MDIRSQPVEDISVPQNIGYTASTFGNELNDVIALAVTGIVWTRYATQIKPKNYNLLSVFNVSGRMLPESILGQHICRFDRYLSVISNLVSEQEVRMSGIGILSFHSIQYKKSIRWKKSF